MSVEKSSAFLLDTEMIRQNKKFSAEGKEERFIFDQVT